LKLCCDLHRGNFKVLTIFQVSEVNFFRVLLPSCCEFSLKLLHNTKKSLTLNNINIAITPCWSAMNVKPFHALLIFALRSSAITHQRRRWKEMLSYADRGKVCMLHMYVVLSFIFRHFKYPRIFTDSRSLRFHLLINKEDKNIFYLSHVDKRNFLPFASHVTRNLLTRKRTFCKLFEDWCHCNIFKISMAMFHEIWQWWCLSPWTFIPQNEWCRKKEA
jgi:hypothetical protein